MGAKGAWMREYLIVCLQYMPNNLMSFEKWMIVLEKLETEDMKVLALLQ